MKRLSINWKDYQTGGKYDTIPSTVYRERNSCNASAKQPMPRGTRWARCFNAVCHARGLHTENELSLQSTPCQDHLFSFAQHSSILPRLVFLRIAFGFVWGFFFKSNKKESPELIKLRETCWDFVLQLSTLQKTLCKPTQAFSCRPHFPSPALQNTERLGRRVGSVFSCFSESAGVKPSLSLARQHRCAGRCAEDAEPSLLFLPAWRWAAALHRPPWPSKRDHEVGTQKHLRSIQFFHVCIKECSLRPHLPLMGRIFNNTSSINLYGGCIHPISP